MFGKNTGPRQPLGERVHGWLAEPEGQQFRLGKWRFWFVYIAVLQLINALLTALIFRSAGSLQNYMGEIILGVGALVGWICVGCLHYSDSPNRTLAQGVSILDSASLLFVTVHFALCCWVYGHLYMLRSADADYKAAATAYNEKAERIQADNVKIAEAAQAIATENTKAARLENDRAYQLRKAAERGARVQTSGAPAQAGIGAGLATQTIELEKPDKPEESAASYIARWDSWIRLANLVELLLVAVTLIYIRIQSTNSNTAPGAQSYTDAVSAPAPPPRSRLGFAQAEDTRPKEKRNWI